MISDQLSRLGDQTGARGVGESNRFKLCDVRGHGSVVQFLTSPTHTHTHKPVGQRFWDFFFVKIDYKLD